MPIQPPVPHPVQRLKDLLGRLLGDLSASVAWGGITMPLNIFINARLMACLRRIEDIADRIRAGTWRPRRPSTKPRAVTSRSPKPPSLVQQTFGWAMKLLPMPYWNANGYRGGVEALLSDPELEELIAAAPIALGRPLRSLCWMFRLKPPPLLAPPRRRPVPSDMPATDAPVAAPSAALPETPPPQPLSLAPTAEPANACGPPQTAR